MSTTASSEHQPALQRLVESAGFGNFMTFLILLNAFTISLQTYPATIEMLDKLLGIPLDDCFDVIDILVLTVFAFELAVRLRVYGLAFFKDGWNCFDGFIVLVSLLSTSPLFAVLRVLRVLRMLRILSHIKSLQMITSIIFNSVAGCLSITLLMTLVLFVFAVAGHALYGGTHPQLFGNLHTGMWTLFRVACFYELETIAEMLVEAHPGIYLYLVPYFIIMAFIIFNFFSGIVVYYLYEFSYTDLRYGKQPETAAEDGDAIDTTGSAAEVQGISLAQYEKLMAEVSGLRQEIRTLNN